MINNQTAMKRGVQLELIGCPFFTPVGKFIKYEVFRLQTFYELYQ